jgi:hypothetical protein
MKRYKEEELHNPLWIRVEAPMPKDVIASHDTLSSNRDVAPIWEEKKVEAMEHLEDFMEKRHTSLPGRWHSLPHDLQVREPHSSNALQVAFFRTPLYKETMRRMKTKWIGLKVNPPPPPNFTSN